MQTIEENRLYHHKYQKRLRRKGKIDYKKVYQSVLAWRLKHPERFNAHKIVYIAIRNKTLVKKPCEVCGNKKVHGHHDDYSKPLSIKWLCPLHHKAYETRLLTKHRK